MSTSMTFRKRGKNVLGPMALGKIAGIQNLPFGLGKPF